MRAMPIVLIRFLTVCCKSLPGNYSDSLSDATLATEIQPSFVKAIVTGKTVKIYIPGVEECMYIQVANSFTHQ